MGPMPGMMPVSYATNTNGKNILDGLTLSKLAISFNPNVHCTWMSTSG